MFEFVRQNTRLFLFLLVLLIIPSFVFFGIQGYSRMSDGGNHPVAKVAGHDILQGEWDAAHREQVERMRRQMPGVDTKLFDTPAMKRQTLDALVRERVILAASDKLHLVTTDDRLQRLFASDPQFAFLRNPDGSVNRDALAAQGMSSDVFAQRLRQDLSMRQVLQGLTGTAVAPASGASAALDALFQQREVQVQRFDTKDYATKVQPTDAQIEAYYKDPAHAARFQSPEQLSVEYVVLDLDALKKDISVSEDELRKYYAENLQRYTTPEERRAAHILIKADKGAPKAEREKAKAKAEALHAQLVKTPGQFAELARKNSDDPGSAEKGGDLDFFARGAMVKPFEDVAFSLKPGEISPVVETDFGYHIIQLTQVRGGEKRSFEAVHAELENEVKTQLAQKRYAEAAVEFTNMVYEQPDSLKPVIDKFKLAARTAQGLQRKPTADASGPLANAKFVDALFGSEAIRNKRNTEAIGTAPNQLVSGRVVKYAPAQQQALTDVRDSVLSKVTTMQAAALARKEGEARLAALRAAPATALGPSSLIVSRAQGRDLPASVLDAVLKAPTPALPTFVGVDLGDEGYAVAKIDKVLGRDPVAGDATRAQAQYTQAWADAEAQAYYAALKSRLGVDIKEAAVTAGSSAAGGGDATR